MALDRFYRLPRDRQDQLLGVAAEAFAEGGYEGTSFNKLLERLGFSKSQAYYYFSDKADLFTTACTSCYEQYYERVAQLPLPASREAFWQYVLELNRVGFLFYQQHPMAARLARAAAGSAQCEQLVHAGVSHAGSTQQRYLEWVELGQRLGAVRSDLAQELLVSLSVQVSACIDVWFSERASSAGAEEIEALSRSMTDLSWRLLHPQDTAPPSLRASPQPPPSLRKPSSAKASPRKPSPRKPSAAKAASPKPSSPRKVRSS
jgi:AcrR family transcriptional regulator